MLKFSNIEISDYKTLAPFLQESDELSCENNFVNLLIWQKKYKNMFAICDGQLILKSSDNQNTLFSLPLGNDFEKGFKLIEDYCKDENIILWAQQGVRFEKFKELYGEKYSINEIRENFDYVYSREELANLTGKKFHSKRNHINAFNKKYNWHYESISSENIDAVKLCAEKWYLENSEKSDSLLDSEHQGINLILDNMKSLEIKGGAIFVENTVVAFTLGSKINDSTFVIHIEKALKDFSGAYAVINNEFAKNELRDFKFINREDDLGLEGLRKAKNSYNPIFLVEKYICVPKDLR